MSKDLTTAHRAKDTPPNAATPRLQSKSIRSTGTAAAGIVQSIGGLLTETRFVDEGFLGDDRVHGCCDVWGDGVADYGDDLVAFFYRLCSLTIKGVHLLIVLVSTLEYDSDGRTWHYSHGISLFAAVVMVLIASSRRSKSFTRRSVPELQGRVSGSLPETGAAIRSAEIDK
ncbi:hypothetical protein KC347_g298 [Hortaea werneckii]|nr:hypothetical protein KC347_g298 [Hortaea werneckii]